MSKKTRSEKNYQEIVRLAHAYIAKSIDATGRDKTQIFRMKAIELYNGLLCDIDVTEYLLLDSKPEIPHTVYIESWFNLGTLYKAYAETLLEQTQQKGNEQAVQYFTKSITCFVNMLRVDFENALAIKQIVSVYTLLCYYNKDNYNLCLRYLQEALLHAPENSVIHYNLGFVYQKLNTLELALIHYKISLQLLKSPADPIGADELRKMTLNNYNGIVGIYRAIKQWPQALHYLRKAEAVDACDPDIQNQLGVVYTEMRRTDLADLAYTKALKHVDKAFISTDHKILRAEILLNHGHMHSYNGDNTNAVANYNKALLVRPGFILPFQNKIMNLSYLFDELDDKMYILKQHQLVNKLFKKGNGMFKFDSEYFNSDRINIGIVSGDFVDHPVSFFISTLLKNFDPLKFTVTCYSECIIDISQFHKDLKFVLIKNQSAEQVARQIYNDKVHILFDLAGHTAFNRLDVFALKPCPTQITYIGYPYSTGLTEMDYRITDDICDNIEVSQKMYTETLVALKNCFLCYEPKMEKGTDALPKLEQQPYIRNKYVTIGCFNRINKITDSVINLFNKILVQNASVRFVFKTKALINSHVRQDFLLKFDSQVRSRIDILDCNILHEQHMLEYNNIDIAIDTFPYSGTTTSCEALLMGVPVFTLYDSTHYFHAQNVTASLLRNSNLPEYVVDTESELCERVTNTCSKDKTFWQNLKHEVRHKFITGYVCNKEEYMKNLTELLLNVHEKSKRSCLGLNY